jgi:hypothetical protein
VLWGAINLLQIAVSGSFLQLRLLPAIHAHAHAMVYGWVGLFVMGFAYQYGILASRYVDDFRRKWIQEHGAEDDALLGTSDIQSLADLGNAYDVASEMRLLPLNKQTVIFLERSSACCSS